MAETKLLDMRYLARCKARGPRAELSAVAWVDGRWSVIVPEPVLRSWFNAVAAPDKAPTFYAALGIAIDATDADIKKAYRRLALTLHPDRNHEPDATEQFRAIQRAYEVLSQADTRARYDAGMKLEALARSTSRRTLQGSLGIPDTYGYRSPLRSGYVMVQGNQQNRWFIVNLILAWADIVDAQGRTLVSSWPAGADHHLEVWA